MGNRKNKALTGTLVVLMLTIVLLTLTLKPKKNLNIDNLNSNRNNQFAFYIQKTDRTGYEKSDSTEFPEGYKLNVEKSECVNNAGSKVSASEILSANGNKVTVTSNETIYCTLYFDKKGRECNLADDKTLTDGVTFVDGPYTYKYEYKGYYSSWERVYEDGWGVSLTNKDSTDQVTTELCTTINGQPVLWASYMFYMSKATSIDLSNSDTSNIIDMSFMFQGSEATSITFPENFGSSATTMKYMFWNNKATSLDLSNFNTSKVTEMTGMFSSSAATELDLSSFNTSNVTNMWGMFMNSAATELDLSNFDTSKVEDMSYMFSDSVASELDLSSFDTSQVTIIGGVNNMKGMFQHAKATIGYAKTEEDASKFNSYGGKSAALTFIVKNAT